MTEKQKLDREWQKISQVIELKYLLLRLINERIAGFLSWESRLACQV